MQQKLETKCEDMKLNGQAKQFQLIKTDTMYINIEENGEFII